MTALGTSDAGTAIGARITVDSLDHVVLTVRDEAASRHFYADVLGMRAETFGDGRLAFHFGEQKLNVHVAGAQVTPHAAAAAPGSTDLCLLTSTPVEGVVRVLDAHGITVEQGPVERTGATGQLLSVYVRDPDGNLVELANRLES